MVPRVLETNATDAHMVRRRRSVGMDGTYSRLNASERVTIMLMLKANRAVREVARTLGRSPSTISREIRRQPLFGQLPYEASRAAHQAKGMRRSCRNRRKLGPRTALFATVCRQLRRGWSPSQIAGRLKWMHPDEPKRRVSHETIYRALYVLPRGGLRRELLSWLRQGHQNRWPRSRGSKRRERLAEDLRIAARPEEVSARLVPGHWVGDLIIGTANRAAAATLVERLAVPMI